MKRIYELTLIIDGESTAAKVKAFEVFIAKTLEELSGLVVKKEDWGKKDLAYKIDKSSSGIFLYYELELEASLIDKLAKLLDNKEEIKRHLIVRKDK